MSNAELGSVLPMPTFLSLLIDIILISSYRLWLIFISILDLELIPLFSHLVKLKDVLLPDTIPLPCLHKFNIGSGIELFIVFWFVTVKGVVEWSKLLALITVFNILTLPIAPPTLRLLEIFILPSISNLTVGLVIPIPRLPLFVVIILLPLVFQYLLLEYRFFKLISLILH